MPIYSIAYIPEGSVTALLVGLQAVIVMVPLLAVPLRVTGYTEDGGVMFSTSGVAFT